MTPFLMKWVQSHLSTMREGVLAPKIFKLQNTHTIDQPDHICCAQNCVSAVQAMPYPTDVIDGTGAG